ncbi:prolipoprotein diacylglyceryl transferase [Geotalea sp. SG265]|uniref:prolipoprotein diacylglyceryl transferase n=1 Tax=Geotalea sp. SG265 TaxID=2922867 RepID=UPI001FAF79E3|nr:prolipoprotein diacylglyceryl transferase [Geotalea sp. SG265]
MTFPHFDPVFLRIGPLQFRWYGLMYIIGFIAAYFIIKAGTKKKRLPLSKDDVADLIFTVALGVILGGRLGYILFYDLQVYLAKPLEIFAVWHGGMSFHGGLLGAVAAGFYYTRKKQIGFYDIADVGFTAAPVGLFLGRIGNFINGELYGRVTDVPWGIVFPGAGDLPRHPSQLYEAILEGPLMFFILWLVGRRKHPAGVVFWSFMGLYGLFRFTVEFFREPDAQLGFVVGRFSMGQMLSLPMLLVGCGMIIRLYRSDARSR